MENIIGQRINTALAARDIKQKELAKQIGVKDNVVSYWCSGTRIPNTTQIVQIAKVLNVSTDYLFGLSDVATNDKDIKDVCEYTGLNEDSVKTLHYFSNKIKGNYNYKFIDLFLNWFFISGNENIDKLKDCLQNLTNINFENKTNADKIETEIEHGVQISEEYIDEFYKQFVKVDTLQANGLLFELQQDFLHLIEYDTQYNHILFQCEQVHSMINKLEYILLSEIDEQE